MPWRLSRFGDVVLPHLEAESDLSPGEVESTLLLTGGGAVDVHAGRTRLPRRTATSVQGTFLGERSLWVDHGGNFIVDQSGNYILMADGPAMLRDTVQALKRLLGQTANLYRKRLEDGLEQYKLARLLAVPHTVEAGDGATVARLRAQFESVQVGWRDLNASSVVGSLVSGGRGGFSVHNDGDVAIEDATLTVTATADVTGLRMETDQGMDLSFGGTVVAGTSLVIDGGAQTVRNNGADAYGSITRNAGHTQASLLRLATGDTGFTITTSGGAGTVTVAHRNQWL